MGLRLLSIHANGGYDVVELDERGNEGAYVEFVGYAVSPLELDALVERHTAEGVAVADFRSPKKLALAEQARGALQYNQALHMQSIAVGGVEREAMVKARLYLESCVKQAMECSC